MTDLAKLQRDTFGYFIYLTNEANGFVLDAAAFSDCATTYAGCNSQ